MRDPVSRSSISNEVSAYAPKWARDFNIAGAVPIADDHDVNHATGNNNNFETEYFRLPKSLDPSLVPEPPTAEPLWPRIARFLKLHFGEIRRYLAVFIIATLVAITVTLLMPAAKSLVAKQDAAAESISLRDYRELNSPAEQMPAKALTQVTNVFPVWPQVSGAHHSDSLPPDFNAPVQRFVGAPIPVPSDPWSPVHSALAPAQKGPLTADSEPTASPMNLPPATGGRSKLDSDAAGSPVGTAQEKESLAAVTIGTRKPPQNKPERPISQDQILTLLNQGQDFVSVGDIFTARILFARVAEARDARGALAMAATYDPVALNRIGIRGVIPDINKAREWYQKAIELGSTRAAPAVEAMTKYAR